LSPGKNGFIKPNLIYGSWCAGPKRSTMKVLGENGLLILFGGRKRSHRNREKGKRTDHISDRKSDELVRLSRRKKEAALAVGMYLRLSNAFGLKKRSVY